MIRKPSNTQTTDSREVIIIKHGRRGLEYPRPTGLVRSNTLNMMGELVANGGANDEWAAGMTATAE